MILREQLMDDLKTAMREQDTLRKRTVRAVIAAIKQGETNLDAAGERVSLDESDILALIAKQAKQRKESIAEYQKAGRADLVAEEQAELAILETYLPQQLSREEIESKAQEIIDQVGATGLHDLGKVMKPLMGSLRGRADGKIVNQVVRDLLHG